MKQNDYICAPVLLEEYLPASIYDMQTLVVDVTGNASIKIVAQIAELRDYAECERYRTKQEVDQYLVDSPETNAMCNQIQTLFTANPTVDAAIKYLESYQSDMERLHEFHSQAALACIDYSLEDWLQLWKELAPIADRDNAHAMFLSSDNWSFSVFHSIISELEGILDPVDAGSIASLLTGGIQDARTYVYGNLAGTMPGASRLEYTRWIVREGNFLLPNGIMPLFAFEAATKHARCARAIKSGDELHRAFCLAVAAQMGKLNSREAEKFASRIEIYRRLYAARTAYDIYEYFGCYAFLRHYLILQCATTIGPKNAAHVRLFERAAATYQFSKALEILKTNPSTLTL